MKRLVNKLKRHERSRYCGRVLVGPSPPLKRMNNQVSSCGTRLDMFPPNTTPTLGSGMGQMKRTIVYNGTLFDI